MFTGRLRSEIPPALVSHFFLDILVSVKTSIGFQSELVEILDSYLAVGLLYSISYDVLLTLFCCSALGFVTFILSLFVVEFTG